MRMLFLNKNKKKGFTLIELLVVISIISLLASIVLSSLAKARSKARDAKRMADLKSLQKALENYLIDNPNPGLYPSSGAQLFSSNGGIGNSTFTIIQGTLTPYIPKIPDDPLNITNEYGYYYAVGYRPCAGITPPFCNSLTYKYYVLSTRMENPSDYVVPTFNFQNNSNLNYYLLNLP